MPADFCACRSTFFAPCRYEIPLSRYPDRGTKHLVRHAGPHLRLDLRRPITNAAWHSKPSWYVVAGNDRTINPDYERFAARRMGARTITVPSSHVAMLAKPAEVAALIISATAADPKTASAR